jgi:aspartate carbamoyltransferase
MAPKPIKGRNPFRGQDILSVKQFDRENLGYLFGLADEMRVIVERVGYSNLLQGKLMASLFYEPSTRTSSSFIAAMSRLGGAVVPINEVVYSSVTKGESLPDTVRTLESYTDVIVLRHPEVGSAAIAAHYCEKPIINAGDGVGEHPTQALLDIFTIEEDHQRVDGLTVAMVGDLKYGRTVHSLTRLLSLFNVKFCFVSPEILRMPSELIEEVKQKGIDFEEVEDVSQAIEKADVLYVTRVQKERFADLAQYDAMKDFYTITPELMKNAKQTMSVMHPLPRVGEISYAVDADPRASYFRQMKNGMYVRMALLTAVLGRA